jgi:hypothetical protein
MINAYLEEREEILYVHIDGETSIDELTGTARAILSNPELPRNLRVMELANAEIERIHLPEIKELIQGYMDVILSKFASIRHAVVTNNPTVVAYVTLAKRNLSSGFFSMEVFSTEEAAKKWLTRD